MNHKSINIYQAIALYIAAILGSGVLFLSSSTAAVAGPASILSWLIVILLSFPLAYAFASLSRTYPDAGGAATFVKMAFGANWGTLVGWFYFFCASVGQVIVSMTGAYYVSVAFDLGKIEMALIALIILFIGGTTNYYGVQVSGKVSLFLSACLLLLLLTATLLSLPLISWDRFTPFTPFGWIPVGTAITLIFWSFFGWEAICNLTDRFKNPDRDIVRSTVISAVVIGVVFLSLSLVTIGTGTYGDPESNLSPIGVMMYKTLGAEAKLTTSILAFIICLGTVNAFVASLTQLGYALSRDGAFPRLFFFVHPRTHTPTRVVVFVISLASIGVVTTISLSLNFDDILFLPNSLGLAVYVLSMAAGVKLFQNGSLPWSASLISLVLCTLCLPFFGWSMTIPVITGGVYYVYLYQKRRSISTSKGSELKLKPVEKGD